MTREEIINGLIYIAAGNWDENSMAVITVAITILESQPSLPEGLEEAAEACADGPECSWAGTSALEAAFKAGAKWQAEQGVSVKKTVGQLEHCVAGHPSFLHGFEVSELDAPFLNSKEVGYGDKVIVQIRKK